MKYLVTDSSEMNRLEEFVKTLPEKFVKDFGVITSNIAYSTITMTINGYHKTQINIVKLNNMEIEFDYDDHHNQIGLTLQGKFGDNILILEYKRLSEPIKKISILA